MIEAKACKLLAKCKRDIATLACLAAMVAFGTPRTVLADTDQSQWIKMVRACEAVIVDQTFTPLQDYKSAPFTMGLPGIKEYAVYNASKDLVVVARIVKGRWVHCLVRENAEKSRTRWREVAKAWLNGFDAAFPKSKYVLVRWNNPVRPFPGAVQCFEDKSALLVSPTLETNMYFRIIVTHELPEFVSGQCGKSE